MHNTQIVFPRDIERCKSINVINGLKDKNHRVISVGAKMTSDKTQKAFIIKVSERSGDSLPHHIEGKSSLYHFKWRKPPKQCD